MYLTHEDEYSFSLFQINCQKMKIRAGSDSIGALEFKDHILINLLNGYHLDNDLYSK